MTHPGRGPHSRSQEHPLYKLQTLGFVLPTWRASAIFTLFAVTCVPLPTLSAHSPNKTTHLTLIHIARPIRARSPSVMSRQCQDTAFNLGTPGTASLLYPQLACSLTPLGKGVKDKVTFFLA
jgi:hypothetical protein